jgi:glycerophosphoryl diester phosphodiesterase
MTRQKSVILGVISVLASMLWVSGCNSNDNNDDTNSVGVDKSVSAQVGPRPLFLVDQMQASELKTQLVQCGLFDWSSWCIDAVSRAH